MVWKHRSYLFIFSLELEYIGWPYREYIKTAKNGSFCEELLSGNDFETVLVNFCCYEFGANASEAVPKISTETLKLYVNSVKTKLAVYYLLIGDASQVSVFFWHKWKWVNNIWIYLLDIGLMLIITKVFTILSLLGLCGNRDHPGSFQNKAVSSKQ